MNKIEEKFNARSALATKYNAKSALTICFVVFCLFASGVLGWILLFGVIEGNLWAIAGWFFGITTSVVIGALVHKGV